VAGAFPKAFAQLTKAFAQVTPMPLLRLAKKRRGRVVAASFRHQRRLAPPVAPIGQLFSSDLIRLSNSSNVVSPLIISPLMKKVGVELTFSTSLANF
jgi:hypothetical protein